MGEIGNIFAIIFTNPIYNALMLLYHLFQDYGLSIVVLTLVIKLALFPLNLQQLKSMKANQALQPKMQEIKAKYANDKQAQMLATQTLYKEFGVNPLAGCLPLVIQLPILYGLYFAFRVVLNAASSHNLNDINGPLYSFVAPFHQFPDISFRWLSWLDFLTPIFHVSWTFSLASPDPTHILPVVAGLATFVQLRMSQPKPVLVNGKPAPPDPSQQTMKMMQYIMPFFTFFLGLTFPAGLALYWTTSALFQAVQQYFVTGWGSLLTTPKLKGDLALASASSNGTVSVKASRNDLLPVRSRNTRVQQVVESDNAYEGDDADALENDASDGAISKNLRTSSQPNGSGSSQYTRRQRGSSASARRRGNTQKSRR